MMYDFNADEIFEMAEQLERNGAKFYRAAAESINDQNAKAFLFQTASNLSIDRIRRVNLERRHNVFGEELSRSVEDTVDAQQTLHTVESALYELPTKCRQAFVMHRRNNLSYPAIAEQLGVSTSMVEKYIIQALKHFRNKLEQ